MSDTLSVAQFNPSSEALVATLHESMPTGESYTGPLHVGYYVGPQGELWIECEGRRINLQSSTLPDLIKQLRRAAKAAAAPKEQTP